MMTKATVSILERLSEGKFVRTVDTGTTKATLMNYVNNGWVYTREKRGISKETAGRRIDTLWARTPFGTIEMERAKRKLLTS